MAWDVNDCFSSRAGVTSAPTETTVSRANAAARRSGRNRGGARERSPSWGLRRIVPLRALEPFKGVRTCCPERAGSSGGRSSRVSSPAHLVLGSCG